jgi:radical SAM protein with 4Fe4S-binding SPASM domain
MAAARYARTVRQDSHPLWTVKKPLLYWLEVELTERCNNNCVHCGINLPADDAEAVRRELTTGQVKGILKEAAALGCLVVKFTGGEPMLRKDFAEIYIYARTLGLRVMILTNATLVTPALAALFSRIPPLEKIEVSLYGADRAAYDAVARTPGSYAKARRGIRLLLKNRVPLSLKQIQLQTIDGKIGKPERWAAAFSEAEKFTPMGGPLILRCRRDSDRKNKTIRRLRPTPDQFLDILSKQGGAYVAGMKEFIAHYTGQRSKRLLTCGAGKGLACLDAYGRLQSCLLLRHPDTVYDLKTGSLKDAMTDFFPRLRRRQARNTDFLSRCANCVLRGLCEQCPAQSWIETGGLDTPVDYLCDIAQTQARFLGLLAADEKPWEIRNWKERVRRFGAD